MVGYAREVNNSNFNVGSCGLYQTFMVSAFSNGVYRCKNVYGCQMLLQREYVMYLLSLTQSLIKTDNQI